MNNLTLNDIAYRVAKHGRITRDEPRQDELDAIKAHISHLVSREAKGEPICGEAVAEIARNGDEFSVSWLIEGGIDAMIEGETLYILGMKCPDDGGVELYEHPAAREARENDVSWIGGTAMTRVNPAQMVRIAQNCARADEEHSYTKVPGFMPHDWVVAALCTAYDAGRQNIIDGAHTDGFTPEAIESVRRIFNLAAQEAAELMVVPDALISESDDHPDAGLYIKGWNDCRAAMLAATQDGGVG